MNKALGYLKRVLSNDPVASYARAASGLAVLVFLGLDTYSVLKAGGVTAGLSRDALIGQAVFVSSVYGCGKLGEVGDKFAGKGEDFK